MTKYQELIEDLGSTNQLYDAIKSRVKREFVGELSNRMGFISDQMRIEFDRPDLYDNDAISWDFSLILQLISPSITISIPFTGFTLITQKANALERPLTIQYKEAGEEATTEDIADSIFKVAKQEIAKTTWL
jgi:hypothetical protein